MAPPTVQKARSPLPPFTRESATRKVRMAEDAWNSRDPMRVSLAYSENSRWRNRSEFPAGRAQIVEFLQRKWARELEYRLIKELWAFADDRFASSNDQPSVDVERKFRWPQGPRPSEPPGLSDLGL